MKLLGGSWSKGDLFTGLACFAAILAIPGMPKLFHWDSEKPAQIVSSASPPQATTPTAATAQPAPVLPPKHRRVERNPSSPATQPVPQPTPQTNIFNNNGENRGIQNNGDNNGIQNIDQSVHINEPPPPPIAYFSQFPLPVEDRNNPTVNPQQEEGESRFHPGVTLQIRVNGLFDDPSFDIICDTACDIFHPFLGHTNGQSYMEHNINVATHGVAGGMTHHRISFEDKLSPSAYISLRVRSRSEAPVNVTSVVSTPNQ